jgi:hypothetical protein
MKILFYDLIQDSDAPATLKSPALADKLIDDGFTITLDDTYTIDCIGIGYTDATAITVNGELITIAGNGLYLLDTVLSTDTLTVAHDGTYVGRLAAGEYSKLGASPAREPGFYSTNNPRRTLSGQVVPGAGGITGRQIDIDVRYKFTRDIFDQIEAAYPDQLGKGFPVFVRFDDESERMPWDRLYASVEGIESFMLQSSANKFLYSRKMVFREAF